MNKYVQEQILGEGGFGKALLCRRKADSSRVVIKQVSLLRLKPKERQDALREAQVLASLRHPNIVQYIESFQEGGNFYIVMEYVDGGDLAQKIERSRSRFSEANVLHDFIQIALALKYCHDRKILHRDLKTQNVFLMKDGTIKLGDFGIARVLDSTQQLCQTQIGTPYYLSPEICEGKKYNSKTDIWSLGCILYELCTGKHPFVGSNMNALFMQIIRGNYTPISDFYSVEVRGLVGLMLTKDQKQRPSVNQILGKPFIKNMLSQFLDETILKYEMNHTILHGRKPLAAPTVVISESNKRPSEVNQRKPDPPQNRVPSQIRNVQPQLAAKPPTPKQRPQQNRPVQPAPLHDPRYNRQRNNPPARDVPINVQRDEYQTPERPYVTPKRSSADSPSSEDRHRQMIQEEQRRESERLKNLEIVRRRAEEEQRLKQQAEEEKKAKDAEIVRKLEAAERRRKAQQEEERRQIEERKKKIAENERKRAEIAEVNKRMAEEKRRQREAEDAERRREAAEIRRLEEEEEQRRKADEKQRRMAAIEARRKAEEEQLKRSKEEKKRKQREEYENRMRNEQLEDRRRAEEERRLIKLEEERKKVQAAQDEARKRKDRAAHQRIRDMDDERLQARINAAADYDDELYQKRQKQIDLLKKQQRRPWRSTVDDDDDDMEVRPTFAAPSQPPKPIPSPKAKLQPAQIQRPKGIPSPASIPDVEPQPKPLPVQLRPQPVQQQRQQPAPQPQRPPASPKRQPAPQPQRQFGSDENDYPAYLRANPKMQIESTILQDAQQQAPAWIQKQRKIPINEETIAIPSSQIAIPLHDDSDDDTDIPVSRPGRQPQPRPFRAQSEPPPREVDRIEIPAHINNMLIDETIRYGAIESQPSWAQSNEKRQIAINDATIAIPRPITPHETFHEDEPLPPRKKTPRIIDDYAKVAKDANESQSYQNLLQSIHTIIDRPDGDYFDDDSFGDEDSDD